ncbi:unnamed protein product [Prunus brigantina]
MSVSEENANIRDHHRRLLAAKYELRRNLYKALCKDPSLPSDLREENRFKLSKLPRNSSYTRACSMALKKRLGSHRTGAFLIAEDMTKVFNWEMKIFVATKMLSFRVDEVVLLELESFNV